MTYYISCLLTSSANSNFDVRSGEKQTIISTFLTWHKMITPAMAATQVRSRYCLLLLWERWNRWVLSLDVNK